MTQSNSTIKLTLLALVTVAVTFSRVDAQNTSAAKQKQSLAILNSDAAKDQKAIACKELAIYGDSDAVPALAALLPDAELASWARIALEAIPGPAPDDALRSAMAKLDDRLLVGVINSIGVRRDAKAVDQLIKTLEGSEQDASVAAAIALGRIGGDRSIAALDQSLSASAPGVRSAAAEGVVLIAESNLAAGNREQSVRLYDLVRKANVPRQRIHEATRGAILARREQGIPLLIEELKIAEKGTSDTALRVARELEGDGVTEALVTQFGQFNSERQAQLLQALADRPDAKAKVLPLALSSLAEARNTNVRVAAAIVLERLGNASSVPALVRGAAGDDEEVARASKTSLARLAGKDIDDAMLSQLMQSTGRIRRILIELAEQRQIDGALPVFLKSTEDPDWEVRAAALVALGAVGDDQHLPELARLLPNTNAEYVKRTSEGKTPEQQREIEQNANNERVVIQQAILSICGRYGAACVVRLLPLTKSNDSATRIISLGALATCGGADSLAAVKSALDDKDPAVVDAAVRVLSNWPNRWREDAAILEPLLALAKSAATPTHRILAQRGYLTFLGGARKLAADQRLENVKTVLPLIARPEEKKMVAAVLGDIGTPGALDELLKLVADPAVAEEAGSAIIKICGKSSESIDKQRRRAALQTVLEKSQSESVRTQAKQALDAIQ